MAFRNMVLDIVPKLSASRINHIMSPLRMVLNEAADRYDFQTPWRNIKPQQLPRNQINPFTLSEVMKIINSVRADYKNYYIVRFFTGLRTGEIDGLQWKNVDFDRQQLHITQALVDGELGPTKTKSSARSVDVNKMVISALTDQFQKRKSDSEFVFCNKNGLPLAHRNVTKRIWYPLLDFLKIKRRTPYQTRHTTASLWLSSGESPEWIAKQMGHTNTNMLFTVYSRYVPNLTRQDGSAFEAFFKENQEEM